MLRQLLPLLFFIILTQNKLQQVVSLFRHGARYHINSYYDGNSTKQYWGELSAVGMRQHQNFGKLLRRDYIDNLKFLSSEYVANSIEIFCTDVNRTLESVRSQLYGLYPLGYGPKLLNVSKQYYIPPFINNTDSSQQTYALPEGYLPFQVNIKDSVVMTDCFNWDRLVQRNIDIQKIAYDEMAITYRPFLRKLGQTFNIDVAAMNFSKVSSLYDTLTVDRYLGRPLPNQLNQEDYLNMRHLHYWFNFFKINFNLSRAINTGKLNRVLEDFDGRINNSNQTLKWTFLSAHDTDISGMLLDLNFSSSTCVQQQFRFGKTEALNCDPAQEYVSNIIFELHSEGNNFYVKVRHDGVYRYLCQKKSTQCPYQQWKARVKKNIILSKQQIDEICFKPGVSNSPLRFESSADL